MVEPLISTTSTGAEVWLVLCELCLSHPRVDVYAHLCWKWMLTLWFYHFILQSGKVCDLYHFLRLRELCLSHPSEDVCTHLFVKWMLTYMV
jgi:hypothetical protein